MCALFCSRHSGRFSALGVPNSELGHPASGAAPLEHGPGRMFTLQPGKERERQESGSFSFFFSKLFIFIVPRRDCKRHGCASDRVSAAERFCGGVWANRNLRVSSV